MLKLLIRMVKEIILIILRKYLNMTINRNLIMTEIDSINTQIIGEKQIKVTEGIAKFSNIIFIAKPETKNVKFMITDSSINT